MSEQGWKRLTAGTPWFAGAGNYPIAAYSEFMPPPALEKSPTATATQGCSTQPILGAGGLPSTKRRSSCSRACSRSRRNCCTCCGIWPAANRPTGSPPASCETIRFGRRSCTPKGAPAEERCTLLLPLALSRTQDDKGRVRWTLFGGSEDGPGRAFWRGFFAAPRRELPDGVGDRLLPPALGGRISRAARWAWRSPPRRLADLLQPRLRPAAAMGRRAAAALDRAVLLEARSVASRRPLAADVLSARAAAGGGAAGVFGGRVALAAVSGQPGVVRGAART